MVGAALLLLLLPQADPEGVDFFERRIRPVLVEHCYACHSATAEKIKGGLLLDTREGLRKGGHGGPAVVPGDPAASLMVQAIRHADPDLKMPPKKKLPADVVADVEAWVKRGAPDPRAGPVKPAVGPHWSLQPLAAGAPASIDDAVRAVLREKGLRASAPADRRTLLRRASFDLTGLPPAPEEIDAFLADPSPDAFARVVDRLLASPAYGERWGRHWLDTVHFGETHGYDKDKPRRNAWPYRDYVIRSFNQDKPYFRFVEEQLAGDVLFPGTADAVVALGFIAAGPWDYVGHAELPESKTDGLIARYNDRDDMLMTTMSTFQSMTAHCARCHDHKFDPIPQEDYYALQAVFAGVDRADRVYDADPAVTVRRRLLEAERERLAPGRGRPSPSNGYHSAIERSPDLEKWVQVDLGAEATIDEIRLLPARPTDFKDSPGFGFPGRLRVEVDGAAVCDAERPNPGDAAVVLPVGRRGRVIRVVGSRLWERTKDYVFALAELQALSGGRNLAAGATVTALDSIEAGRWSTRYLVDGFDSRASLPVAPSERLRDVERELAALPKPNVVFAAATDFAPVGSFVPARVPRPVHLLARGDVKKPGKPSVPGALSCVPGLNARFEAADEGARRAALAKWITDPANVLTCRSIVNRVWQYHFGRGLVETPNDFGRMGAAPTHPALLDGLAREFRDGGGSLKALHRKILLSATWQQSSANDAANAAIDAENRFLWRMNRTRLDAESFRDALLAAAGTLDRTMGGPSVEQFVFKDDHSPVYDYSRYDPKSPGATRRSVYRFVVRSVPDPFVEALDGADPSILTPRRNVTLTALQALATLNDPLVLRHCEALAARAKSVEGAFRLALGRAPTAEELGALLPYAEKNGLANVCRLLINTNEFWFVD